MGETIIQILTIMGVLSIPSIIWNIFLYKQNKKYKKWDAERNLRKSDVEIGTIESQFESDSKKLLKDYDDRKYQDLDSDSERFNSWEKEQGLLQEKKNENLRRIDADANYYKKISGHKTPNMFWVGKPSKEKIKIKINRLWRKIKMKSREIN